MVKNGFFGTCLLLFILKIAPRLHDVDVRYLAAQKMSLQPIFGTNWASLLNAMFRTKKKEINYLDNANFQI